MDQGNEPIQNKLKKKKKKRESKSRGESEIRLAVRKQTKFLKSILNVVASCAPSWSWSKIGPNSRNWIYTTGVKKAAATISARRLHGAVVTFTSPESHLVSLSIQSFQKKKKKNEMNDWEKKQVKKKKMNLIKKKSKKDWLNEAQQRARSRKARSLWSWFAQPLDTHLYNYSIYIYIRI